MIPRRPILEHQPVERTPLVADLQPPAVVVRYLDQRRRRSLLPELALRIGRSVRAGRPLPLALADADDHDNPGLTEVVAQVQVGRSTPAALSDWLEESNSDAEELLIAALLLASTEGGDVGRALDVVGEGIRDDVQLEARRLVLLTQTRLSAAILVGLPLVFAGVASAARGEFVYSGVVGMMLLVVGLLLDGLGLVWIRRLLRRMR